MSKSKTILSGAIVFYFIICFEVLIMISPFAGFFYLAFNPVLLGLAKFRETKWLSSFFFTHMVVPPNAFLKSIRLMGSVLFGLGLIVFLACAVQVYASKLFKKGQPVLKGMYSSIRHPQYLSLGITAVGLAILWPRFVVVVLWLVMIFVYYLLSKDEEARMERQHPETYKEYMARTGMFLPKRIEDAVSFSTAQGKIVLFLLISVLAIGGAFLLRNYTVNHLPLWTDSNVVALAVFPEDEEMMDHRMGDILKVEEVNSRRMGTESYLVYFLPTNYAMQGLVADTGIDWRLYRMHHSIGGFVDLVIHPFSHLGGGHHFLYEQTGHPEQGRVAGSVRRLIFLKVSNISVGRASDAFAIKAARTPDFMVDLDVHSLSILDIRSLPIETAWGKVPTPSF
jgi:protein-S-isoprenylcysteine O-methyltransferase Ste14